MKNTHPVLKEQRSISKQKQRHFSLRAERMIIFTSAHNLENVVFLKSFKEKNKERGKADHNSSKSKAIAENLSI